MPDELNFNDFYLKSKITVNELKQFHGFENLSEVELQEICENLFDLASLYKKIMIESNGNE